MMNVVSRENAVRFNEFMKSNHVGKQNSIKARDLSEWGNPRAIRQLVNTARKEGYPICSGTIGYWYAESVEDIQEVTNQLKAYIKDLSDVCDGLDYAQFDMVTGGI